MVEDILQIINIERFVLTEDSLYYFADTQAVSDILAAY